MTPEIQARIFDPFFTTKFTGRGLGLSAVLGIIRGHRGALKVYSAPGQGTTFKLLFPVYRGTPRTPVRRTEQTERRSSGVILVIDDEDVVLRTATSVLRKAGYQVVTAVNGEEGLEKIRQQDAIDAVLLDMTMPVLSGEATLRQLKAIRPSLPVILSSGYNEVEAIQRFAGKGLAGFLQKPYAAHTLLDMLGRILAKG
jgi:CheY-like chemotaxis protein